MKLNWFNFSIWRNVMKRLICVLSLVVCVVLIPSSVNAYVFNVTTGEMLFCDTFQRVVASSSVFPDTSGDYDPVAMTSPPSAWACKNEDSLGRQIQVTDSTTSPDVGPAPDFGPNYLRVSRVNADPLDPMTGYLEAEAQFVPAADGDRLHFAYWINSPYTWDCTEINLWQNTGALAFQLLVNYQSKVVFYSGIPGGDAGFSSVFQERVWQKWEIDYVNGASTIDISIDGVTNTLPAGGWNLGSIAFSQGAVTAENALYVGEVASDSIPGDLPGDTNDDGIVDAEDAATLAENWLAGNASWAMGDFNHDGLVNDIDATLLAANWQSSTTAGASVPEPSCLVLLGAVFMAFGVFRRTAH